MAWRQIASDIPLNDWSWKRGIRAVAVRDQVYLFGYNCTGRSDTLEALAFNPRACTWSALPPLAGEVRTWAKVHFAVASKEKVFVCVGAHEMKVFDTRTSRWSSVTTSGNVEFGRGGVRACELDGHVYMCRNVLDWRHHVWVLDLSSLQWEIVDTWDRSGHTFFVQGLFPYENCLYVLFSVYYSMKPLRGIYFIRHFDFVARRWEDVSTWETSAYMSISLGSFIHGGKLFQIHTDMFNLAPLVDYDPSAKIKSYMEYSFATKKWVQVKFKGAQPPFCLTLVCVVDHMAVFFSCRDKKVCVLDFSWSLRKLCIEAIQKYHLDTSLLPPILQKELKHYNFHSYDMQ